MARKRFNLDKATLDGASILIHGGYGKGKTHLAGDMLRTEQAHGEVMFLNIPGEDGWKTTSAMGLGDVGVEIEDFADLRALIDEYTEKPIRALALDSAKFVSRLIERFVTGSDRTPRVTSNGPNEWGEVNRHLETTFSKLRRCAKYVMVVSPSDKSVDQLSGRTLWTPDLPGRNAVGSAGWFDFVFVVDLEGTGPGRVSRILRTGISNDIVIRTRSPKPLPASIDLPEGGGGWKVLLDTLNKAYA